MIFDVIYIYTEPIKIRVPVRVVNGYVPEVNGVCGFIIPKGTKNIFITISLCFVTAHCRPRNALFVRFSEVPVLTSRFSIILVAFTGCAL